jgi:hypothetical protein
MKPEGPARRPILSGRIAGHENRLLPGNVTLSGLGCRGSGRVGAGPWQPSPVRAARRSLSRACPSGSAMAGCARSGWSGRGRRGALPAPVRRWSKQVPSGAFPRPRRVRSTGTILLPVSSRYGALPVRRFPCPVLWRADRPPHGSFAWRAGTRRARPIMLRSIFLIPVAGRAARPCIHSLRFFFPLPATVSAGAGGPVLRPAFFFHFPSSQRCVIPP